MSSHTSHTWALPVLAYDSHSKHSAAKSSKRLFAAVNELEPGAFFEPRGRSLRCCLDRLRRLVFRCWTAALLLPTRTYAQRSARGCATTNRSRISGRGAQTYPSRCYCPEHSCVATAMGRLIVRRSCVLLRCRWRSLFRSMRQKLWPTQTGELFATPFRSAKLENTRHFTGPRCSTLYDPYPSYFKTLDG